MGAVISEDGRCIDDVKQRIAMGKEAFNKRRELMTGGMDRELKKRLVKALIWSVALEKISLEDKKKNEEVLDAIREERSLVEADVKRKKN